MYDKKTAHDVHAHRRYIMPVLRLLTTGDIIEINYDRSNIEYKRSYVTNNKYIQMFGNPLVVRYGLSTKHSTTIEVDKRHIYLGDSKHILSIANGTHSVVKHKDNGSSLITNVYGELHFKVNGTMIFNTRTAMMLYLLTWKR